MKKRRETKSGQAALKIKKWKFEEEMSFVVPYMQERDTCTNLIDISDDVNEDGPNEKEYDDKNEEEGDDRSDDKDDDKDDGIDGEDVNESLIEDEKKKKQKEIKRKVITKVARNSGNKCQTQSESASAVMVKYLLEKIIANARITPPTPQPSAIDTFFSSIAATVNNFSPYYQNIAKSQIFSIISELKMKQIMQEQPFFVPNTPTQRQHSALMRRTIPLQSREACPSGPYTVSHPSPSPSPSPSRSPFLSSSTTPTPSPSSSMVPTPTPSPSVYDFPATISNPHLSEQTPYTEYMKMQICTIKHHYLKQTASLSVGEIASRNDIFCFCNPGSIHFSNSKNLHCDILKYW